MSWVMGVLVIGVTLAASPETVPSDVEVVVVEREPPPPQPPESESDGVPLVDEAAAPEEMELAVEEAPTPALPPLQVKVKMGLGGGPSQFIKVTNPTDEAWTECTFTLKGLFFNAYSYQVDRIGPGEAVKTRAGEYTTKAGGAFRSFNELVRVIVFCDQGQASVWHKSHKKKLR